MKQMKKEYKRRFPGLSVAALRSKLMSTVALLLVASSLLVTSSYAWFVLSTAPEVSGIQTQVGANGSLEVALLNSESWANLDLLDMGDIDESADVQLTEAANLTWGNLVDLSNPSYGLGQITLNPSRLYIQPDGDGFKINSTLLKTPVYAEDGRVKSLDTTSAVAYVYGTGGFNSEGHGVRAIGTSATMSVYQLGIIAARSAIATQQSEARTAASNALNEQGGALAGIVVKYAVSNQTEGYTASDVQAIKNLATGLQDALNHIETGLRYAFAGYIGSADAAVAQEQYETAVAAALDGSVSLPDLMSAYPGITTIVPEMASYISKLNADQTKVAQAISDCDAKIAANTALNWNEINALVLPLMDTDNMLVAGKTMDELKALVFPNGASGEPDFNAAFELLSAGGITITVPSGSGLLSDIADFAGNYTANVTVENFSYGTMINNMNIDVGMTTATAVSPVYLRYCMTSLTGITANEATGASSITDFYGYAVDLAFRTNAEGTTHLQLQTTPENRIYEGSNENDAIQGSGSYMIFRTTAGLSATKMVKLMQGIRVVFMDEEQSVLSIAALDCTLGKDNYTELPDEEKAATGKYAFLDATDGDYQVSDLITYEQYSVLAEESHVVFDKTSGTVRADLYLYEFSMPDGAGSGNNGKSGALALDDKKDNPAITELQQDVIKRVTAVVYIDGSYVTNATVAANAAQSMTGTLNMQFSSDAMLMPAEITALRSGEDSGN